MRHRLVASLIGLAGLALACAHQQKTALDRQKPRIEAPKSQIIGEIISPWASCASATTASSSCSDSAATTRTAQCYNGNERVDLKPALEFPWQSCSGTHLFEYNVDALTFLRLHFQCLMHLKNNQIPLQVLKLYGPGVLFTSLTPYPIIGDTLCLSQTVEINRAIEDALRDNPRDFNHQLKIDFLRSDNFLRVDGEETPNLDNSQAAGGGARAAAIDQQEDTSSSADGGNQAAEMQAGEREFIQFGNKLRQLLQVEAADTQQQSTTAISATAARLLYSRMQSFWGSSWVKVGELLAEAELLPSFGRGNNVFTFDKNSRRFNMESSLPFSLKSPNYDDKQVVPFPATFTVIRRGSFDLDSNRFSPETIEIRMVFN
jgi:hypothetical protein